MIRKILLKDWLLLWPMVMLVTAIQLGLEWAAFRAGLFGADAAAVELLRPLTLAWYAGIAALTVAVVQQDPVPGIDQDWLVRPIRRRDLLIAKVLFVVLTISLPMFALNFAHAVLGGFPAGLSVQAALWKEAYLFICMLLPLLALAAITRNMAELAVLGAALVVTYALSLFASAMLLGADRCPTCTTGLSWQQHLLQHVELLAGSAVVLWLQYFKRRTLVSRALAVAGALLLVAVQVPWDSGFAFQERISRSAPEASMARSFTLAFAPEAQTAFANGEDASGPGASARTAGRAILRGDLDKAVDSLRRRGAADSPALVDVSMKVSGLEAGEKLLTDRSRYEIRDPQGRLLDVASSLEGTANGVDLNPDMDGGAHETVIVPRRVIAAARSQALSIVSEHSMTVMALAAQHEIRSIKGRIRAPEIGLCETRTDDYAVHLRCAQVGPAPFCFSATLYAPDGRHNPETLNCEPDYRPDLPAPSSLLNSSGLDVHYRDPHGLTRFPIDPSEMPQTHLLIRIYRVRAHISRRLDLTARPAA